MKYRNFRIPNWGPFLFGVCLVLVGILGTGNLWASEHGGPQRKVKDTINSSVFFDSNQLLEFTLTADFVDLLSDTGKKRKYHKCQISYLNEEKQAVNVDLKIKTRGKFRLRKMNCNFPPLKFNFSKEGTRRTIFEGQDKLKFVSHCQNSDPNYEQHTLEEYLIYRLYNLITDQSYRVRLAKITYIDTNGIDTLQRFGFFVEDRTAMAQRHGRRVLQYKNIQQYDVLRSNMIQLSLFQMMIGNSDWSVERLHNIDLISVDDNSIPIAVPFDFDWAGLIGHSYFVPDPNIDPEAKYQRIYKSYRWDKEELEKAIQNFLRLKPDLYQLISEFPYLRQENREKCMQYISEFYEIIESKRNIKDYLVKGVPKLPN